MSDAGAQTNAAYNCVDRHVEAGHGDRVALFWYDAFPWVCAHAWACLFSNARVVHANWLANARLTSHTAPLCRGFAPSLCVAFTAHREGNDPCHSVSVTYKQLQDRVYQITNYLTSIGVKQALFGPTFVALGALAHCIA
eukprot:1162014-Pelagomonas_calceolata.AAC.15